MAQQELGNGWVAALDPGSGRTYYANTTTVRVAMLRVRARPAACDARQLGWRLPLTPWISAPSPRRATAVLPAACRAPRSGTTPPMRELVASGPPPARRARAPPLGMRPAPTPRPP